MRIYIIGNDGITLCREPPTTVNEGEIVVASNEELHAARLSGKRLLALWNALPDVEKRKKVGDRDALVDELWWSRAVFCEHPTMTGAILADTLFKVPVGRDCSSASVLPLAWARQLAYRGQSQLREISQNSGRNIVTGTATPSERSKTNGFPNSSYGSSIATDHRGRQPRIPEISFDPLSCPPSEADE
jgi:hypothetical protein